MPVLLSLLLMIVPVDKQLDRAPVNEEQCKFQHMDRAIWTQREEWRTARCVTEKWTIPGGLGKLSSVISCESGWDRLAYNPNGPYVGLGQHALSSWTSRVDSYEPEWWTLKPRWSNSRSAITITVRMVQAEGWSAWTCA